MDFSSTLEIIVPTLRFFFGKLIFTTSPYFTILHHCCFFDIVQFWVKGIDPLRTPGMTIWVTILPLAAAGSFWAGLWRIASPMPSSRGIRDSPTACPALEERKRVASRAKMWT